MCESFSVTGLLFALCIQGTTYGESVRSPFPEHEFQNGMNVFLTQSDVTATDDYIWTVQLLLDRLAEADVNSVSVTWPLYTGGKYSSEVFAGADTPTPSAITTFAAVAEARGFGVMLHPILDEAALMRESEQEWRGTITPRDVSAWFESYTDLLLPYLHDADAVGIDAVSIAAELESMEGYTEEWRTVVDTVRASYNGLVTYSANRRISAEFPWEMVDFISVDAFFALDVSFDASQQDMQEAMRSERLVMEEAAAAYGLPIVFTEIGTTSQAGSFQRTMVWNHRTGLDLSAQSRYYDAVCAEWRDSVTGFYWWTTTLYPLSEEEVSQDIGFDPFGKPAETSLRHCSDETNS